MATNIYQTPKSAAYDNAVSLTRFYIQLPLIAAGAGGTSAIYYARGNETLWSIGAFQVTPTAQSTSSLTTTATLIGSGGTSTTVISTNTLAQSYQPVVMNFTYSGTTTTTTTTTYGSFPVADVNGTWSGSSGGVQYRNNWTAFTASGGGINLGLGARVWLVAGTDTAATAIPLLEMSITPEGNVAA